MKDGVVAQMTAKVKHVLVNMEKNSLNDRPIASSTLSRSDENRFKIRPTGVVSKKLIGERNMALAMPSCSLRDACIEQKTHMIRVCTTIKILVPDKLMVDIRTKHSRSRDTQNEVNTNVPCDAGICARSFIRFRPILQPYRS